MKFITIVFLIIFANIGVALGQKNLQVETCCNFYSKKYFGFSIYNNSDSILKFTFENINDFNGKNILKYYKISKDTIICELLAEKHINFILYSSPQIDFYIDGEPYYQRTIRGREYLKLNILLKKWQFKTLNNLKIILPDSSIIYSKIK